MNIRIEVIPKSQVFVPDDTGGWLFWSERVLKPGFRSFVRYRTIRKEFHTADMSEKISDPAVRELADQCGGATP